MEYSSEVVFIFVICTIAMSPSRNEEHAYHVSSAICLSITEGGVTSLVIILLRICRHRMLYRSR